MSTSPTAVAVATPASLTEFAMRPADLLRQAALIQEVMHSVMKDGEHFGVIPGTEKKDRDGNLLPPERQKRSLFKSGAEKLCFVFGLAPKLEILKTDLPGGHREYQVITNLFDRAGNHRGQGVGCASTYESKHRYRGAAGKVCPSCGAQAVKASKKEYGGGYYCDQRGGGCGWKTKAGTAEALALDKVSTVKAENPDPADQWNTVLKMASKRSLVDATLKATAASDIFAQDLEDLEDGIAAADEKDAARPAAPQQARTAAPAAVESQQQPAASGNAASPAPAAGRQQAAGRPGHPAQAAGIILWRDLEAAKKTYGKTILDRLAALHGAKAPKDIPADKLEQFGKDVAELQKLVGSEAFKAGDMSAIESTISEWERMMAQEGGAL